MIDSNNLDVIRTNIRTLNEKVLESNGDIATIIEDVSDLEDDVGTLETDVESIKTNIGTTPLPEGSTITSVIDLLTKRTKITGFYGIDITKSGSAIVVDMYTTESKVTTDAYTLQVRPTNNDIRLLIKEGGTTTYNKSVALT